MQIQKHCVTDRHGHVLYLLRGPNDKYGVYDETLQEWIVSYREAHHLMIRELITWMDAQA
jgi:hypothetical protein